MKAGRLAKWTRTTAMEWFIVWLVFAIIAAMVGSRKGQALFGFLLGFILGPLGLLIMIFTRGNRRQCPHCREMMHKAATVCPHCQQRITAQQL